MKNENLVINLEDGQKTAEIVIREVSKVNELEVKAPVKIRLHGTIGAPTEFLFKRKSEPDQINPKRCHVIVDREAMQIVLITNENDEYLTGLVSGALESHPKFKEFGINTGKVWTPTSLGMFFKMNRTFFTSREDNMKLVSTLMNFVGTVNNSIERAANERGDKTDKFEQVVNSNLPASFSLKIPIFKGMPHYNIEVETFAQINGKEVSFTLLSPGAQALVEDIRDNVIDEQIALIRDISPDLAIIEQ